MTDKPICTCHWGMNEEGTAANRRFPNPSCPVHQGS